MTPEALAAAIIAALTGLESQGVISIGGWAAQDVDAVLSAIGGVISTIFTSAGNGGMGGQSSPPGTDGSSTPTTPAS